MNCASVHARVTDTIPMSRNSAAMDLKARKPVKWWHEAIVDDMLAFPTSTLAERSIRLKYTSSSLSIIINSDAFKAMYEERRRAYNERLDASIQDKTARAVNKALDIVLESLENKRDKLPFQALTEFTDRTLERLGYGIKKGGPAVQVVNLNGVTPQVSQEQLADARKALRAAEESRMIDVTPLPSEPAVPVQPRDKEES